MTDKRPEYIKCIKQTYDTNKSWCNRDIPCEFAFMNINHAIDTVKSGSRMTICHECRTVLQNKIDETQKLIDSM